MAVAAGAVRAAGEGFAGACLGAAGFAGRVLERTGRWGFLAWRRGARDRKVREGAKLVACRAWGLAMQTTRFVARCAEKADMVARVSGSTEEKSGHCWYIWGLACRISPCRPS